MSSAAERARQKAEARRQRILSKSADRLGVVTGIVAPSILKGDGGGGENSNAVSSSSSFSPTSTTILTNEAAATIITPEPDASTLSTNTTNTTTMRVNTNEEDRDDTNHQISPRSDCDNASVVSSSSSSGVVVAAITTATDNNTSSSSAENESSRGARRMAAMRKRRYQSKTKVVEEEDENVVILEAKVTKVAGSDVHNVDAKANANTHGEDSTTAVINQTENKGSINFDEEQSLVEPTLTNNEDAAGVSSKQKKHQPSVITTTDSLKSSSTHNVIPTIDEKKDEIHDTNTNNNNDDEEHHHNPKKYMGVARIRRQKVKEQRSQRLQAISDADILSGSSPTRSSNAGIDLVRELSAEVATMEITASMVRRGGMVAVLDDTTIGKWASARGLFSSGKRRSSSKWYSVMLPPMTLVPRLITLMLLFLAGLDLGTQPYRPSSSASYFGYGVDGDFTSAAMVGSILIGHVEHSLTKPWEYGMGGKVAYTVGITTTSPPTALPTSFLTASDDEYDGSTFFMECGSSDEFGTNGAECVGDYATTNTGSKEKNKNKSAVKKKNNKNNIKLQLMEDEFDSTHTRPRGVVNHHNHQDVAAASEFDDVDLTAPSNYNNIDPLFQIDLDALLHNAHLPLPIDYAAKFAIGFHRTWVHYLWKLPTSLVKTIFGIPMKLLSGWIANPPWILGVVLLIRFVTKVLVGSTSSSGKSFSLDSEHNEDAKGSSSGGGGGGGGGGNLDVMEKIIGAAKNYASSSFPRTSLVFGTLMQVMKVDMYVLLCGMLIGLVMSSMDEKMIGGGSGGEEGVGGGRSGMVLGDGEL